MGLASYTVGSEVEVRSNDEGFRGAWFEATVVKSLPKYRRFTVAYATLVDDDAPSKPLEDTLFYSYLRPRPPRGTARFELHQLVEAFHNDGWWRGVVSRVPEGEEGNYWICFPSTREEFEFKVGELREQVEWVKGNWVPVQNQEGEDVIFDVGNRVEVSRDRENYGAAWFVGTVLKVIGKSFFLVEYESLRVNHDRNKNGLSLKEIVDLQYIRPSPPIELRSASFNVSDEVEACYLEGWIAGVVMKILSGSRYTIKLKHREEEIELDQSALRLRFEWINEHWVHASRDENGNMPHGKMKSAARRGKLPNARRYSLPVLPTFNKNDGEDAEKSDGGNLKGKKMKVHSLEGKIKVSQPPPKRLKKGQSLKEHLQFIDGMNITGRKRRSNAARRASLNIHVLSRNNGKFSDQFGLVNLTDRQVEELRLNHNNGSLISGEGSSSCLGEGSEHQSKATDLGQSPAGRETADCLRHADLGSYNDNHVPSENKKARKKKFVVRASYSERKSTSGAEVKKPRKRGRPPKKKISLSDMESKQLDKRTELFVGGEDTRDLVELYNQTMSVYVSDNVPQPCENYPLIANAEGNSPANNVDICFFNKQADIMEESPITHQIEPSTIVFDMLDRSAPRQSAVKTFNVRVEDILGCSYIPAENGDEAHVQVVSNERAELILSHSLCNTVNIESNAAEPMPSEPTSPNEDIACDQNAIILDKSSVETEGRACVPDQNEITTSESLLEKAIEKDQSDSVPTNTLSEKAMVVTEKGATPNEIALPFTKGCPMWETVELMDVFRAMPQQPHFHPLQQYEMEFREGMAIGLMVTFANLVQSVQNLRLIDPVELFEEKLKALAPLECNGFDVSSIRTRVERLLEIRNSVGQSESKKVSLEEKIMERDDEREKLNSMISSHDKVIDELEGHLRHYREKRASLVVDRDDKESEKVQLKMDLQATEEALVSAEDLFSTITDARW